MVTESSGSDRPINSFRLSLSTVMSTKVVIPYCQTEEGWKRFGREGCIIRCQIFWIIQHKSGVDYSNEANNLPEVSLQSILPGYDPRSDRTGCLCTDIAKCGLRHRRGQIGSDRDGLRLSHDVL